LRTIDEYIDEHIDEESALLTSLRRDAHVKLLHPRMIAGHLQGRLLKMICRIMRPGRILEIGTYTGYATLCMAEGIDNDALIYTVDINDEMQPFTIPYIEKSPYKDRILLFWGDIMELYPTFNEVFDIVYIDADKRDYCAYYDLVFPRLKSGGLILADNTLWSGKVIENIVRSDKQTQGIVDFNRKIKGDSRIEKVIIPLRDGLTMIWKK
jgi:predicted O-methyltransferase YrrM